MRQVAFKLNNFITNKCVGGAEKGEVEERREETKISTCNFSDKGINLAALGLVHNIFKCCLMAEAEPAVNQPCNNNNSENGNCNTN